MDSLHAKYFSSCSIYRVHNIHGQHSAITAIHIVNVFKFKSWPIIYYLRALHTRTLDVNARVELTQVYMHKYQRRPNRHRAASKPYENWNHFCKSKNSHHFHNHNLIMSHIIVNHFDSLITRLWYETYAVASVDEKDRERKLNAPATETSQRIMDFSFSSPLFCGEKKNNIYNMLNLCKWKRWELRQLRW